MLSLIPFIKTVPVLIQKYNQGMSLRDLAVEYDTYPDMIRHLIILGGGKLRNKSEAQLLALKQKKCKCPTRGRKRTREDKQKISQTMKVHKFLLREKSKNGKTKK